MSQKKVNPYAKKAAKSRRITKKQRTTIVVVLCVAAIIAGIIVAAKLSGASAADPHAGHNHATGEEHTEDDGHDHSSGATNNNNSSHGQDNPSQIDTGVLNYRVYTNADQTFRVTVVDKNNKVLFQKDKTHRVPVAEKVTDTIFTISWATGDGPNDFESIFCNKETGAVSALFYAPRGYDGRRVAYSSDDQTVIIVQDIFNKSNYLKHYTLKGAYTEGDYIIRNGKLAEDNKVQVTYVVNKNNGTHTVSIPLYD